MDLPAAKTFDDLGGMSIKIGDWYTSEDAGETDYAKATEDYRKEIMEKYNFKINRESAYSYTDQQETYVTALCQTVLLASCSICIRKWFLHL